MPGGRESATSSTSAEVESLRIPVETDRLFHGKPIREGGLAGGSDALSSRSGFPPRADARPRGGWQRPVRGGQSARAVRALASFPRMPAMPC